MVSPSNSDKALQSHCYESSVQIIDSINPVNKIRHPTSSNFGLNHGSQNLNIKHKGELGYILEGLGMFRVKRGSFEEVSSL